MLELKGVSKRFPGVTALDDVSLAFEPGRIHAVVGENGAGKSTLIRVVTGILQPDAGEVHYEGQRVHFRDIHDSLALGIAIVNQEIQIVPDFTVAENIMLDKLAVRGWTGVIDWRTVEDVARRHMEMVGLAVAPGAVIRRLSAAQKQLAQIAKALASKARVLLLDEPTSSLTEHEAANLFVILRRLRDQGVTIIFVSHKFEEVFALCDTVGVLRDGRHVGTRPIADITPAELVRLMIGRDITHGHFGRLDPDRNREALRAEHIVRRDKADDISFSLFEGEILGFYGLVGAGRTELARILIGEDRADSGAVFIRGETAHIQSVADGLERYRLGYVTENRKEEGLLLDSPVRTNITITIWPRLVRRLTRAINRVRELTVTRDMIRRLDIRTTGPEQRTEELSGGNQQKICMAKWLVADCDILIIDEPTIGVDIGAKEQIHKLIWDLAKNGRKAVILISSDMPEIIRLSSRILVFKNHRIVGEIAGVDTGVQSYTEVSSAIGSYLN
jgi:ribose transport system ATP-binding protein